MAIKNWYLEKEGFAIASILELKRNGYEVVKETEKAVLIHYHLWDNKTLERWIPKSCIIDEWETKFSPKAIGGEYHAYLVKTVQMAYHSGNLGEKSTFTSGRNVYNRVSFRHQWKTADLIEELKEYGVPFMTKEEFAKTLK